MAENESFFRKVVRFVANPATEWSELTHRQEDARELELEKSELKAMIERKRRNDFVRKREFDMLRRVRREGLSPEQLAALGTSSRLDDSEARAPDGPAASPTGVKAKIDEIEQQMVGEPGFSSGRSKGSPYPYAAADAAALPREARSSRPVGLPPLSGPGALGSYPGGHSRPGGLVSPSGYGGLGPASAPGGLGRRYGAGLGAGTGTGIRAGIGTGIGTGIGAGGGRVEEDDILPALPPLAAPKVGPEGLGFDDDMGTAYDATQHAPLAPAAAPAPVQMATGLPPLAPLSTVSFDSPGSALRDNSHLLRSPFAVEVSEVVHDPELDEAVIAFANADFSQCEDSLRRIISAGYARHQHAETWLVLFDLYRATGQQHRFESLALDYAQQFGWSAPQWYSLPQMVAEATSEEPRPKRGSKNSPPRDKPSPGLGGPTLEGNKTGTSAADVGWICPEQLDIDAVAKLRSQTLQLPLPWVLEWSALRLVDPEAAMQLSALMRQWASQSVEMRWIAGDRLLTVLQESAPTGMRDADPVFWLTRLDALRLANRADQFDEAAIDYCVTYEVSPPSWEPARCKVSITDEGHSTRGPWSAVSDLSTSFMESSLVEDAAGMEIAQVELAGQLVGDISHTLNKIHTDLGTAPVINVSCTRLIRVDFIAAGDLLNWVLTRGQEGRAVHFVDAHRLVALFFGAMGINEHAKVQVRKV